jgi:hypothetical protein
MFCHSEAYISDIYTQVLGSLLKSSQVPVKIFKIFFNDIISVC